MLGPSRRSLAEAREAFVVRSDDPGFATVADELLAVSKVLGESSALRGALADAGTSAERKQALVRDLFGPGLSELTVEVLQDVAARRWSSPADLNDAVEQLGAEALFVIAERAGTLDTIEDDLFRFARIVEAEPQLSAALGDLSIPGAQRAKVVTDLLQGKVDPTTVKLVSHVVANPRGRRVEHALEQLSRACSRAARPARRPRSARPSSSRRSNTSGWARRLPASMVERCTCRSPSTPASSAGSSSRWATRSSTAASQPSWNRPAAG